MGQVDGINEAREAAIVANEQLFNLVRKTGLDIGQISRLFNKNTREVSNWVISKSVPKNQRERLQSVHERIMPLGYSPSEIRSLLLKSSQGKSLFHMLVDEVKDNSAPIQVRAISVRDALGV